MRYKKQSDIIKPKLNTELVTAKLREMRGNISAASRACGVSRETFYVFIQTHPSIEKVLHHLREEKIDTAESVLDRAVLNGEAWAVCFYLKTQAKHRGYVERQENTGADGAPLIPAKEMSNDELESAVKVILARVRPPKGTDKKDKV